MAAAVVQDSVATFVARYAQARITDREGGHHRLMSKSASESAAWFQPEATGDYEIAARSAATDRGTGDVWKVLCE